MQDQDQTQKPTKEDYEALAERMMAVEERLNTILPDLCAEAQIHPFQMMTVMMAQAAKGLLSIMVIENPDASAESVRDLYMRTATAIADRWMTQESADRVKELNSEYEKDDQE